MLADTILILVISIFTALLGEGVTWLLVYRTEKYQKLKTEIEKQSKRLEKKKEESATLDRSKKKKLEQVNDISLIKLIYFFSPIYYCWLEKYHTFLL